MGGSKNWDALVVQRQTRVTSSVRLSSLNVAVLRSPYRSEPNGNYTRLLFEPALLVRRYIGLLSSERHLEIRPCPSLDPQEA